MGGRTSRHKDKSHHRQDSSSSSSKGIVCVLSDHQPVNHKDVVLSVAKEPQQQPQRVTEPRAHHGIVEFPEVRASRTTSESRATNQEGLLKLKKTSARR